MRPSIVLLAAVLLAGCLTPAESVTVAKSRPAGWNRALEEPTAPAPGAET